MGGANKCMFELAVTLKNRGWKVHISVLYSGCPLDLACKKEGIPTVAAFYGWWCEPAYWNIGLKAAFRTLHGLQYFAEAKLIRYIKQNNINLIHTNSLTTDIGAKVAQKAGIKHVWHFREYGKLDYNLEFFPSREKCLDHVSKHSDIVLFMSEGLRKEYKEITDSGVRTDVVYDGILNIPDWQRVCRLNRDNQCRDSYGDDINGTGSDMNSVTSSSADNSAIRPFTFLISGNLIPGKNQRLVLEAARKLCEAYDNFQVWMAGAATDLAESKNYEKSLKEDIVRYGLESNVKLLGYITDMPGLRRQVDAEIMASRSEAYGRVTIEAIAAGNLIIASASGANPELIGGLLGDKQDYVLTDRGILFRENDIDALCSAMEWAMTHPTEKLTMEEAGNTFVNEYHRNDLGVSHVERIYESL